MCAKHGCGADIPRNPKYGGTVTLRPGRLRRPHRRPRVPYQNGGGREGGRVRERVRDAQGEEREREDGSTEKRKKEGWAERERERKKQV